MKIISILGSPRGKKSNTGRLLEEVQKGARHWGATCETIQLKGASVLPCLGCDKCHVTGWCVQKDEFESIKGKILAADGLILASPNYIFSVSAQLKAFMDRCCGVLHCMSFEGKYGASIVTSGGGDEKPITDYMNHFLITTGISPVGALGVTMGNLADEQFTDEIRGQAFALGEELVLSWKGKKRSKRVDKKMAAFKTRMEWLISYRKREWPYEYDFWRTRRGMK
ncbi:MAG: flavodoxin family protein [Desulfobacteraceae bacterium]|nr:MAG: flavodoxin family protein [Desulfobacteraceae bacterium]